MPPKAPAVRRRAVELARLREKPIGQIAKDLGIAESGLRRWMAQADIDEGRKEGLSTDDRTELARHRSENRTQTMEIEIWKRATAYFARETCSQNRVPGSFVGLPQTGSPLRWRAGFWMSQPRATSG